MICHTNFMLYFRTNFSVFYTNFLLLISIRIFCVFLLSFFAHLDLISYEFYTAFCTNFLLFFAQIRLPRLFCFYNLTKRSSFTLLHAVHLKQWFWLYYLYYSNFLMQNPSYNVSDCFLFWLTCAFTENCSVIATNYCPVYFL